MPGCLTAFMLSARYTAGTGNWGVIALSTLGNTDRSAKANIFARRQARVNVSGDNRGRIHD